MKSDFSTEELIKNIKNDKFILNTNMPMGYVPGLPILSILNGNLCMKIPFLKYKVTGEIDNTFVYPVRYVATVIIPENIIACFEDLSLNDAFANVNFSDPIGKFRHKAIQNLDKTAYRNLRSMLYGEYDKIVNSLTHDEKYNVDNEKKFKALFNTFIEPSLIPFYKVIDKPFTNKYLTVK